jgi:hypothetical protein
VADIGVVVGVIGKIKPRIGNYTLLEKNRMLALEMAGDARVVLNASTQGLLIAEATWPKF